tara:strand:+ start:789 stop:905 length:117 start_codon:yes stop_codon:yes gene_type:complete
MDYINKIYDFFRQGLEVFWPKSKKTVKKKKKATKKKKK